LIPEAGLPLLRKEAEVDVWPGPEDETPSKEEIIHGSERRMFSSVFLRT